MAKKASAFLFSVLLIAQCMLLAILIVNVANANPINVPSVPAIQISYPLTSMGGYVNSTVEFEVYVNMFIESPKPSNVSYSLDGEPSVYIEDLEVTSYYDYGPDKIDFKTYKANVIFEDLSEGNHTMVACANDMSASTSFIVNSHYQVTALNVLSPISQIYSKNVPLTFTFNGEIENAHYYLYKGYESVSEKSLSGNVTLDNLSDGSYDLYLFVTTDLGQDSKAVRFSVSSIYAENLPIIVGATVLFVFSAVVAVLVYFKKRKRRSLSLTTANLI